MIRQGLFVLLVAGGLWTMATVNADPAPVAAPTAKSAEALKVVMYTTKDCGYCAKARSYFKERNVQWEERDISASPQAHKEWKEKGGIGTPLILINGRYFQGFDQSGLDAALSGQGV
jgi:glutaredoxin